MELAQTFINIFEYSALVRTVLAAILIFALLNVITNLTEKQLLKKAKTKKQITNIELFHKVAKLAILLIIIWASIISYAGSLTGLGISLGLFSVIIAWTLMRPLLGVVAWLTLIVKRPFAIGDRIMIGTIKGDVEDITLTHIYIREVGGLAKNDDASGSLVTIPNAFLFEHPITNYTDKDNYVLQEVSFVVTRESDIDKATRIALDVADKIVTQEVPNLKQKPYIRTSFHSLGMRIDVRFSAPAKQTGLYTSDLTYAIHKAIHKAPKVKICG